MDNTLSIEKSSKQKTTDPIPEPIDHTVDQQGQMEVAVIDIS